MDKYFDVMDLKNAATYNAPRSLSTPHSKELSKSKPEVENKKCDCYIHISRPGERAICCPYCDIDNSKRFCISKFRSLRKVGGDVNNLFLISKSGEIVNDRNIFVIFLDTSIHRRIHQLYILIRGECIDSVKKQKCYKNKLSKKDKHELQIQAARNRYYNKMFCDYNRYADYTDCKEEDSEVDELNRCEVVDFDIDDSDREEEGVFLFDE